MASLTDRAIHATWWSALEISGRYGIQFVVAIALARLLDPADFGLMAMLLVFVTLAALLVEGGLGSALVQKQHPTRDDETTVFLASLGVSVLLVAVLWLVAPAIARFYSRPQLVGLMHLLVLVLPLGAMAAVPNALLSLRLDFRPRAGAELVASLVSGSVALWLAWRGFGVWSLVWQAVIGACMRTAMLWPLSRWRPSGRFDPVAFRRLFRFGGFLLLANTLNTVSVRLQSLLIGRVFDARALGFYAMAQETQQAPAQFMSSLLNRVGLPVFSTIADQPDKLRGGLRLSLRVAIFVFVPAMTGIAVCAHPLVTTLYGERWTPAAPLLSVLAMASMFWPMHVLNLAALGARGRSDLVFRLEVVKCAISVPLVVAASFHSVQAVAWAVLLSNVACLVANTYYSRRLLGYGLLAQLSDQKATFLLTLLSSASALLAMQLPAHPALALAGAIATGILTFATFAILMNVAAWRDLVALLRKLRPDRKSDAGRASV
ncbi:lipopolysaccharide biosynthesis protein [Luteimonas deserti]|uniref:Lipopolysaccharide biosynthesis protein n=1 Tax=Luteimonas deserti TaxID=2752306 RepID=A0A7Z0TUG5_9GAMM|nr:lipopolysaccharide biosynthesis protein [Luteimonas deserti]NYZ62826.1 lipopolysaccharide biosynthesis protein [Luteimonas deserti]